MLSLLKDRPTQERLLEGLRQPRRALVPVDQALRLLSNDVHADVIDAARKVIGRPEIRKNKAAAIQATRILAGDPQSVSTLEQVLANGAYSTETRRVAATALSHLAPERLEAYAGASAASDAVRKDGSPEEGRGRGEAHGGKETGGHDAGRARQTHRHASACAPMTATPPGNCCGSRAHGVVDRSLPDDVHVESDLMRVIEAGREDSALTETLLSLLDERHRVYHGVSTAGVIRMRGSLLLALAHRALPVTALPFVLEELESAHDAWLTAAAARILRRFPQPSAAFAEPLLSALLNIRHRDELVRLPAVAGVSEMTSATREVVESIAWLGHAGRSCIPRLEQLLAQNPGPSTSAMVTEAIATIRNDDRTDQADDAPCFDDTVRSGSANGASHMSAVRFQDHAGTALSFADVFHGRPSIVVFFYTRCDNPAKCPLTMYRFGRLQRLVEERQLGDAIATAAITYDPDYDRADRLRQYAESWGVKPSDRHRILRTVGGFDEVSAYFSLGVNFSASGIVNRHRLEAYVLDGRGRIAGAVTRRRWDEAQLVEMATAIPPCST